MDFGKAFIFVTEDDEWIKKIGFGAAMVLFAWLIVPAFFILGYQIEVMRRVINNHPEPLPSWEEWGKLFMDGLAVFVAGFVYALPAVLLAACSMIVWLPAASGDETLGALAIVGVIVIACLFILFALALAFVIPAVYIQYVRHGDFGSMFRVKEVIEIARGNLVNILIIFLVVVVANFLLGLVTWIPICGQLILLPAGNFWISVATAYLYGQIAGKSEGEKLELSFSTS
jgi:hypothetical protein